MRSTGLDSPDIGARAKEIADERLRAIVACTCKRPDGGGELDSSNCPVHKPPVPVDLLCGLGAITPSLAEKALREIDEARLARGDACTSHPRSTRLDKRTGNLRCTECGWRRLRKDMLP